LKKSGKNTKKLKEANMGLVIIPFYNPSQIDKFNLNMSKIKKKSNEDKIVQDSTNEMFSKHVKKMKLSNQLDRISEQKEETSQKN
jgi:hypothetical protein